MIQKFANVEKYPDYMRDLRTNAIVLKESTEYNDFVARRNEMNEIKDRLSSLEMSFNKIEYYLQVLVSEKNV